MKILIKNGLPASPQVKPGEANDILISAGSIEKIGRDIPGGCADEVIAADKKIIVPAVTDMHVHLRQPGREDKETIASGSRAALAGGITSVLAMPNTNPAIDSSGILKELKAKAEKEACINVFFAAAITKKRAGGKLTDIKALAREGAKAISDDGDSLEDEQLMLDAFRAAAKNNILVVCHCEDKTLAQGGVLNQGFSSTCLGLPGIPKAAEFTRVARDIKLARQAGARVHIAHVSCRESVEIIAAAKKQGIEVTAETAPHYFSLSEGDLRGFDTNLKINPPLRGKDDIISIKQALADGTIDVIASDHAPHTENEKDIEFERAEFGTTGLETELAVSASELIGKEFLDWPQLVDKMSIRPAEILGIKKAVIKEGLPADLIIFDPSREWTVSKKDLFSKSKNCCFLGRKLKGKIESVFYKGKRAV